MLESCRRAAVVHPTGTGKSFLAFQLIEDHPDERFLWLSPNDYIFENQRRNSGGHFSNVEFMACTTGCTLQYKILPAILPRKMKTYCSMVLTKNGF